MPIYRPGYVMAAIYQDDESILTPTERLIYRLISRLLPYRMGARARWLFGQKAAIEMYKAGIRHFLVPGAGIPTSGHVHQLFPDAHVLYIDKDETIVREARGLLAHKPRVRYVQGDLSRWSEIEPACREFLGSEPRVGILFIGASYFFPDELLGELFSSLHEFAGPGSMLVVDNFNPELLRLPAYRIAGFVYRLTGSSGGTRNDARFRELISPWVVEGTEPIIYIRPGRFSGKYVLPEEAKAQPGELISLWVAYKAVKKG